MQTFDKILKFEGYADIKGGAVARPKGFGIDEKPNARIPVY
jgi:hypothetical protein